MPTISLKTVYSTLTELAELGLIKLSTIGSSSLRVDPDPSFHAHLVCKSCGRVKDQPLSSGVDRMLFSIDDPGFTIEEQELIFRGRCDQCVRRGKVEHAARPDTPAGEDELSGRP